MPKIPDFGSSGIGDAEWLAELESLSRKSDEGQTAEEMAEAIGVSVGLMRRRLHKAMDLGWLVRGSRSTPRIDGRPNVTPVYRIVRPTSGPRTGAKKSSASR